MILKVYILSDMKLIFFLQKIKFDQYHTICSLGEMILRPILLYFYAIIISFYYGKRTLWFGSGRGH